MRRQKKGKAGNAAQYITRTRAVRKLQLRLSEFRRLCILKGIHPREPKKKVHGANKTYYHVKDINWLMHEPLLQVFRDMKAHQKKIRKAQAKFNPELAAKLRQLAPTYKLDHLVKERYPSFVDALRDLDDALTMVQLFATLPAEKRLGIPNKAVDTAKRLALEWNAWVVRSHALRKSFISVKGIYFQADVLGQQVTWLIPHQLAQVLPIDVDYKVMLTFLEFYHCLLQFVNFKLYHAIQLKYPPVLDSKLEEAAAGLAAIMKELSGVAKEEGKAADEAVAALKAADQQRPGKAAAGNAQVTERLKALDAAKIAELAGDVDAADGKGSDDEEEEMDSEAGLSSDDEAADLDIDSGDDDEDDEDDENDADSGDDQDQQQPHKAKAVSLLGDDEEAGDPAKRDEDEDMDAEAAGPDGESVAGGALGEGVAADDEAAVCGSLFKGLTFFLSREVPREALALVIRAFGGVAAWDGEGSPCTSNDESVTHHVVDRPVQGHKFLSRAYIQPQWVFDCSNFRVLLPVHLYGPGKAPPPHLSPFINNEEEGYTPDWANEIKKYQEAAKAARTRASGLALPEGFAEEVDGDAGEEGAEGQDGALVDPAQAAEIAHQVDLNRELRAAQKRPRSEDGEDEEAAGADKKSRAVAESGDASDDDESDESDGDDDDDEMGGGDEDDSDAEVKKAIEKTAKAQAKVRAQEAADEALMKDVMMTRKNRKLYERIQRAVEGKKQRVEVLHERKAAIQKKKK